MTFRAQTHQNKVHAKKGWESSDFPILCATCLGDNPFIRMTRAGFDKECKVCARPFTVFRWKPGRGARFKKTEICQICAKLKNVCQTCLLDLEFGLPVQVRDSQLPSDQQIPESDVNREYYAEIASRELADGIISGDSMRTQVNQTLRKLARTKPYYKRNRPHICSFFIKGTCTRGDSCPYRHELPDHEDPELAKQNIKDRYYGVNDPVAKKMLRRAEGIPDLTPPTDKNITTLYVSGVSAHVEQGDLRGHFYGYGEIENIRVLHDKHCAFVTYRRREAAERAAHNLKGGLSIKGVPLRLAWGRSSKRKPKMPKIPTHGMPPGFSVPGVPSAVNIAPPTGGIAPPPGVALPPGISNPATALFGGPSYFPSMDPSRMGSAPAESTTQKKKATPVTSK